MANELSTIKVPEKVYIGFQGRRTQDDVPLGFMTPYGEDQAGQKRMATVDGWARGYYGSTNKAFNSVTLDNKPMIGFKIGRAVRRYGRFSGNSSKIRVEDPRGFELEISIENMLMLMNSNIIEDGELVAECVWGRDGNANVLLPLNSEPYAHYLQTQQKKAAVIGLKNVKVGDSIELLTGEKGVYLGACYPVRVVQDSDTGKSEPEVASQKRYVLQGDDGHFRGYASIKVSSITKSAPHKLTAAEVNEIFAKSAAQDPAAKELFIDRSNWPASTMAFVVDAKGVTFDRREEVIDWKAMVAAGKAAGDHHFDDRSNHNLYAVSKDGTMLLIQWYYHFTNRYHIGMKREYTTGANRGHYLRDIQTTDGAHGSPVKQDGVTLIIGWLNTHIDLSNIDRIVRMNYTVKTADGAEIQAVC